MGSATEPERVKLFIAVTFLRDAGSSDVAAELTRAFGPSDFSYGPVPFDFTDYYADEMGGPLDKLYVTFERPATRESLAEIKTLTNRLEARRALSGKRTANIDPGYLSADKLVLASTKDFYHRVYLSAGIYAEVTLHYRKGQYRFFSWTFPDYREPGFLEFLERVRARYVKTVRDSRTNENEGTGNA